MSYRILVLGGYGFFGGQIVKNLLISSLAEIYVAGRSLEKAKAFIESMNEQAVTRLKAVQTDAGSETFVTQLANLKPNLVIHTCGPYQETDYTVARACIDLGIHYIDLSDDRNFVKNIDQLDLLAKRNGCLVVSGASSVPGLSTTVVRHFSGYFDQLDTLHMYILPGNKAPRGLATVKSILSYVGKPFKAWKNGRWQTIYGWQDMESVQLNSLGNRWATNCDIPDLALLPELYPDIKTVLFKAGLELPILQWGTWFLSWFSRARLIRNWAAYARPLKSISELFLSLGTDSGGMRIDLYGLDTNGKNSHIRWQLIAQNGKGPVIPTLPATILANKLINNTLLQRGATACVELFTLAEFQAMYMKLNLGNSIYSPEVQFQSDY